MLKMGNCIYDDTSFIITPPIRSNRVRCLASITETRSLTGRIVLKYNSTVVLSSQR